MGSSDFTVLSNPATPLSLAAGEDIEFTVAYSPTGTAAPETATIRIITNDPAAPVVDLLATAVHGVARLATAIADSGDFGNVCLGSFREEQLTLNNTGSCRSLITKISSSSVDFLAPEVAFYPLVIGPGESLEVMLRFAPSSLGAHAATITVFSDDPSGPRTIAVSGDVRAGKLAITGSNAFGGVSAHCCADRTISICNVGGCELNVSSVAFKRKSSHWKLLNNPFPATLHPGSCLGLTIRYKATEKCPRCCELLITSDDPAVPGEDCRIAGLHGLESMRLRKMLRRMPQGKLREEPLRSLLAGIPMLRRRRLGRPLKGLCAD